MRVLFVASGNKEFNVSPFVFSQGNSLENAGVELDYFIIKGKGILGYLKNIPELRKRVKSGNYDIIHSHYSYSAWVSLLSFSGLPQVVSFMGTDVYGDVNHKGKPKLRGKLNYLISKLIQPFMDEIIVKSERLGRYVYLKHKMHVVPNGVNFSIFRPQSKSEARKKIKLSSNKKQILFLGNKNNPRKNFSLLNDSLKQLDQNQFELLPFKYPIAKEKVPLYLNSADVVIMTSFLEGSPNVVKEAMACNKPIVSVDVGDVPEVIGNTEGCYVVDYNARQLANKIIEASNFEITTGRKDIEHLEINNIANRIISIYQKALKQ